MNSRVVLRDYPANGDTMRHDFVTRDRMDMDRSVIMLARVRDGAYVMMFAMNRKSHEKRLKASLRTEWTMVKRRYIVCSRSTLKETDCALWGILTNKVEYIHRVFEISSQRASSQENYICSTQFYQNDLDLWHSRRISICNMFLMLLTDTFFILEFTLTDTNLKYSDTKLIRASVIRLRICQNSHRSVEINV